MNKLGNAISHYNILKKISEGNTSVECLAVVINHQQPYNID